MIVGSLALRAFYAFLLVTNFQSLPTFLPLAFGILVAQKAYAVSRSALVPTTVRGDEEFVKANAKLSLLSGVMGFVAAGPGFIALHFGGPEASLMMATIVYAIGLVLSFKLPALDGCAAHGPTASEKSELHAPSILMGAGGPVDLFRGIVGFLSILVAFGLRTNNRPLLGVRPGRTARWAVRWPARSSRRSSREVLHEEIILIAALASTVVASALAAFLLSGVAPAFVLALAVGIAGSAGKLAFDSIVQRDAPDANRGRSFARLKRGSRSCGWSVRRSR